MDLVIKQHIDRTETVSSSFIDVLYQLTKPDSSTGQPAANAVLVGRITAPAAYEDAVNFLNDKFSSEQDNGSDFQIIVLNDNYYIRFADHAVEEVLKLSMDKDEGITVAEAAVANISTVFKSNNVIVSFDELKYFIRPNTNVDFSGCSNLVRVDITNCSIIPIFSNCSSLEYFNGSNSVQGVARIPDGITSITNRWTRCNGVTELHFPDSLTTIGQSVFEYMSNLSKVYFGSGITTIYSNAFYQNTALAEVHIPDLDTWLDIDFIVNLGHESNPLQYAHHLYINGTEVTSVDFTGRTSVGTCVLRGGTSITSVVLTSAITSIGDRAFQSCSSLVIQDLNLPNLTTLGSYAFMYTKVQQVSDLGQISKLDNCTFSYCNDLTSVVLPQTCTSLGVDCFLECKKLTGINTSNVTSFGSRCFRNCYLLESVDLTAASTLPDRVVQYCRVLKKFGGPTSTDGELNLPNLQSISGPWAFEECDMLTNVVSLGSLTSLPQGTFFNCHNLQTVDITGITSIGKECFSGCRSLTSISLPSTLTSIGNSTFRGCTSLTSITIPNSVTSIGSDTFNGCSSLTSITIPNGVTTIGAGSFYGCSGLTSVTIYAVTPPTLGIYAFLYTNCPIYVPTGNDPVTGKSYVDIYKETSGWSTYASRIEAIPTE